MVQPFDTTTSTSLSGVINQNMQRRLDEALGSEVPIIIVVSYGTGDLIGIAVTRNNIHFVIEPKFGVAKKDKKPITSISKIERKSKQDHGRFSIIFKDGTIFSFDSYSFYPEEEFMNGLEKVLPSNVKVTYSEL
jgi:hypothetical protein